MTQLEIEIAHSIEQIFEQAELEEVTLIGSAETSEAEAPEEAEIIESSPEGSCVELGGEVEVCFVFYLLQASGSSWQSRRNQGQGWLRQETPQLQAGMTLRAAFAATWCEGCGAMAFFTLDGDSISPDTLLAALPLPWLVDGISVVPRRRIEGPGADKQERGTPYSAEGGDDDAAKRPCRRTRDVKNKRKRGKAKGARARSQDAQGARKVPPSYLHS